MGVVRDRLGYHRVYLPSLADDMEAIDSRRALVGRREPLPPATAEDDELALDGGPCGRCGRKKRATSQEVECAPCRRTCPLCGGPKSPVSNACEKHTWAERRSVVLVP